MIHCPSCQAELEEGSRFCSSCGGAVSSSDASPTETSLGASPDSSFPSLDQARFLPGAMVAERYRIVGLLGRGGMGEVYRADDLKLGQPVALKFLPSGLERDRKRLDRFLNEVRTALRVTHPNVCRVFDIGEVDGHHYLSMEYVDGEDAASLLRRIGRLPEDKAVQMSRQLCAGLAAAHEQGILHRDLKPANVMIDGRGQVKITDFGLAGLEGGFEGAEVRVGTPAYMAPEQLAGKEVTARSDVYGLGLVLYELFTGKQAFSGKTAAEIARRHAESAPASPSTLIEGLNPAVERVILRCLEKDPDNRPDSVHAVAAALPGGDPLAAAVAAGETPSPEMVAAAGEAGTIPIKRALIYVGIIAAGLVGALVIAAPFAPHKRLSLDKAPAVLEDRARQLLSLFDYDEPSSGSAYGLEWDPVHLAHIRSNPEVARAHMERDRPSPLRFWYRQSPEPLVPVRGSVFGLYGYRVTRSDPPPIRPHMAEVRTDMSGRLVSFRRIPPTSGWGAAPGEPFDWSVPFREAGLDMALFEAVEPTRAPPVGSDARRAWTGVYPESPEVELSVAAASLDGRPVYFELLDPWALGEEGTGRPGRTTRDYMPAGVIVVFITVLSGCAWIARRNLRLGRGDRRGALRLWGWLFAANMVFWVFAASHVGDVESDGPMLLGALSWALARSGFTAMLYIALEPYIRRNWPDRIISWSRLLAGRFRDPLVGRDTMFGLVVMSIAIFALIAFFRWGSMPTGVGMPLDTLTSPRYVMGSLFSAQNGAVGNTFALIFVLIMLRMLLRKAWIATTVWGGLVTAMFWTNLGADLTFALPLALIMAAGLVFLIHRCGLLSLVIGAYTFGILFGTPMTLDLGVWYSPGTIVALTVVAGMTAYAFVTTTRGQTLFADDEAGPH